MVHTHNEDRQGNMVAKLGTQVASGRSTHARGYHDSLSYQKVCSNDRAMRLNPSRPSHTLLEPINVSWTSQEDNIRAW